jgi:hypothetical protein
MNPNKDQIKNSIIDESPELDTEAELSGVEFGQKLLTKIQDGSLVHTAISLIAFSPITIYFIIPGLFAQGGLLCCCIVMTCFLLATYFSLCIILRIIIEKRFPEYNAMIKGFLDNKFYYLFHILHHIFYLGYSLFNVFIVHQLLSLLITTESMYPKLILMISAFIFQFPLTLLTKPDIQRIIKIIQMIFIIIGSILYIVIDLPSNESTSTITSKELIQAFLFSKKVHIYFIIFGTFNVLTFHQINIFQEISHMKTFTIKRGHTLIKIVLIIHVIIIFTLGIIGSFTQRQNTRLYYFFRNEDVKDSKMLSILLMLIMIVCLSESAINVSRGVKVALKFKKERIDRKVHGFLCGIVVIVINMGCILIRKKFKEGKEGFFIVAFGGIVISVIEYLIPGLLYLKIIPDLSKNQRYMNVILYSVMIVFGLAISSLGLILLLR